MSRSRGPDQEPAEVARRYGLGEGQLTEAHVDALAERLRTLQRTSPEWSAAAQEYDRVLIAHLEAVHHQKQDKEFTLLGATVAGRNATAKHLAMLGIRQLHNEAHDRV